MIARPRLGRNHALAAAAFAFAGLAVWPWLVAPTLPDRPPPAPQAAPPAPAPLPPLTNFAAMVERPLFTPSRRPEPASAAAAAAAGPAVGARYRLLGVIGVGSERRALVADGARPIELRQGDALDGLRAVEIAPDRLVLSSPAGEVVLKLSPAAKAQQPPQR